MTQRAAETGNRQLDRFSRRYRAQVREDLKGTLPTLTYRDIRRYREPYHLALCQELHEDQLEQSARYVERLLKLEQDIRGLAGPGTAEWVRPQLRNQIDFLNKLRIGLTEAEQSRTQGQAGFDCGAYLQLGLFFMQKSASWWWLSEQLLLQAVAAGQRCMNDGGRREAIARFVYGSFLLDNMEDASAAHKQLEVARKLSAGCDWSSELDMGVQLDSVFTAASLRLHGATVALIKQKRPKDPRAALRLRLGNAKVTEAWLEKFLDDADLYGLDDMVAAGHRYIGEFYLSQDYASQAQRHLVQAFTLYFEAVAHGARDKPTVNAMEQTRALAGVATAHDNMPQLQETIRACTGRKPAALTMLLRWRDIRAPFWRPIRVPAGSKFQRLLEDGETEGAEHDEAASEREEDQWNAEAHQQWTVHGQPDAGIIQVVHSLESSSGFSSDDTTLTRED